MRVRRIFFFHALLILILTSLLSPTLFASEVIQIDPQAIKSNGAIQYESDNRAAPASSPYLLGGGGSGIQRHSVGLGVGETFLHRDFANSGDDAITPDFFYSYSASYSFDGIANFHMSTLKHRQYRTRIQGLALGIKGKFYQFDAFSPFLLGGFGFYRPQIYREVEGVDGLQYSERKTTFGYHLGAGVDLRLNNHVTVGMLAHYHNPFDIKQDVGGPVEGSYFKLLMTAFYTF